MPHFAYYGGQGGYKEMCQVHELQAALTHLSHEDRTKKLTQIDKVVCDAGAMANWWSEGIPGGPNFKGEYLDCLSWKASRQVVGVSKPPADENFNAYNSVFILHGTTNFANLDRVRAHTIEDLDNRAFLNDKTTKPDNQFSKLYKRTIFLGHHITAPPQAPYSGSHCSITMRKLWYKLRHLSNVDSSLFWSIIIVDIDVKGFISFMPEKFNNLIAYPVQCLTNYFSVFTVWSPVLFTYKISHQFLV